MSFITRFSLDINRLTIVVIASIIILGLLQFFNFARQEDPPIVIREVVVTAFFPGMKPADMEELVTRRLEAELRSLPELADIWSDSQHGVSIIHAETRDEFDDLDLIWQKVRNRMSDVRPKLPSGTLGPFVNDEFGLTAVATVALRSEGFSMADMRIVARDLRDRLYELPGIRKVQLHGVHEEQVFLNFSATRLAQFGITAGDIVNTLVEQNIVLPGGRVDAAEQAVIVSPTGNFRGIDDIENVEFTIPETQQTIRLRDIVTVERGYADPPRDLAYFKGERAIVISVSITPGVNSVAFGEQLTRKLELLESQLPIGYVLEYATFQPDLVEAAVDGGLSNVYQTILIVLVVVMVFLGVRTGLIVGSFVPMTMLLGMIIMPFLGIELERVSIASSIIALGMLVDNGIVIAEDIRSRLERGQDRREACIETGRTLAIPLLTSSLTDHPRLHAHAPDGRSDGGIRILPAHGGHHSSSVFVVSLHVRDPGDVFLVHEGGAGAKGGDGGGNRNCGSVPEQRRGRLLNRILPRIPTTSRATAAFAYSGPARRRGRDRSRRIHRHADGAGVFRAQHRPQPVLGLRGSAGGLSDRQHGRDGATPDRLAIGRGDQPGSHQYHRLRGVRRASFLPRVVTGPTEPACGISGG